MADDGAAVTAGVGTAVAGPRVGSDVGADAVAGTVSAGWVPLGGAAVQAAPSSAMAIARPANRGEILLRIITLGRIGIADVTVRRPSAPASAAFRERGEPGITIERARAGARALRRVFADRLVAAEP